MINYLTPEDIGKTYYLIIGRQNYAYVLCSEFVGIQNWSKDGMWFKFKSGQDVWGVEPCKLIDVFYTRKEAEKELYKRKAYYKDGVAYLCDEFLEKWGIKRKEQKMITKEDIDKKRRECDKIWIKWVDDNKELSKMIDEFGKQENITMTECLKDMDEQCCARQFHKFASGMLLKPMCGCTGMKKCDFAGGLGWVDKKIWKCVPE